MSLPFNSSHQPLSKTRNQLQAELDQRETTDLITVKPVKTSSSNSALPLAHARVCVESCSYEGRTYQLERRRCGKKACKCVDADLRSGGHGPYWYAYWKESGKLRTQYVGKRPPWQKPPA
ncbi:hypothetical protein H6F89_32750 [Cyanobacteria bacterium FACHB-63]|nr:hypothetical protein [Cyanobacteria bacterium FACHB-63]